MSIFGFPFLEMHLTVSFQHCISLPQACIDSDVTVLRRDPALECVIPSTAINSTHFTLRYTSQTAHDVKKRRVDIEEEERLRTFASSGGVPAPRQQKPVSSSGKPAASKGTAAKDVSFKDGIVPSFLVPVVPDALAGRLFIDGVRFEKGFAVKLRATENGQVVHGRLVGVNITDCKRVPLQSVNVRCVVHIGHQAASRGTTGHVIKCNNKSLCFIFCCNLTPIVLPSPDCCRILQKDFKNLKF